MSISDRLDQIDGDIPLAARSPEMAQHFTADHGPELLSALRAVLDLHKPRGEEVLAPECSTEECDCEDRCRLVVIEVCGHCCELGVSAHAYAYEEGGIETVTWPCPTVRAIEAALGVAS